MRKNALSLSYVRQQDGKNDIIPMTGLLPAKPLRNVEGILTIGHEVRSLFVSGDTCDYWIVDKTDKLIRLYDSIAGGNKVGIPVYARLQVADMGKSDDGFAKGYDKILYVFKIDSLASCEDL